MRANYHESVSHHCDRPCMCRPRQRGQRASADQLPSVVARRNAAAMGQMIAEDDAYCKRYVDKDMTSAARSPPRCVRRTALVRSRAGDV